MGIGGLPVEGMEEMISRYPVAKKPVVLLTGNTGYIGTVMTRFLKEESFDVVGLDIGWFENNNFFTVSDSSKPDRQIKKDIRNISEEDLEGIDAVVHLAGLSNDPLGEINHSLTDEINCRSTIKLAELCRKRKIARFIFASSCSIYGISSSEDFIAEEGIVHPLTSYAKAKVEAERGLAQLADDNFHPVFMRNATVYGVSPRLRLDLVVNNLSAWAYLTKEIAIKSDGTPWRPIVHIEDFCAAFVAALKAPADKIHCEAFNVGINEENYRVSEIAFEVQKNIAGSKVKILNETGGDERSYRVDFSKIRRVLPDFKPRWNVKRGISELLDAYTKHNLTLDDFNAGKYFRIKTIKSFMGSGKMDKRLLLTGGDR